MNGYRPSIDWSLSLFSVYHKMTGGREAFAFALAFIAQLTCRTTKRPFDDSKEAKKNVKSGISGPRHTVQKTQDAKKRPSQQYYFNRALKA